MNFTAHELLETQEALRSKAAEIEQHGAFIQQCEDSSLMSILKRHQQQMLTAYQQGINLLQGKGQQVNHQPPRFEGHNPNVGIQQQATMASPNPNAQKLSDQTIGTLTLTAHKNGSVMGMVWANECVDPQVRQYHVQGANFCQEMAYEVWNWMNHNGYYQPPTFSQNQVNEMQYTFQPSDGMNQTGMQGLSTGTQMQQ